MLAIRNGHVSNHFIDKFIHLCHVGYFINSDERKLMVRYISRNFYTFKTKFYIFIFQAYKDKSDYLFLFYCSFNINPYYIINVDVTQFR